MGRKPTGKIRKNINVSLHPSTILLLNELSHRTLVPVSRLIEKAVLEMAEREATRDKIQE